MLPWWGWVVLWAVLLAVAVPVLWVRGRRVWRSMRALGQEVERTGHLVGRLDAVSAPVHSTDDGRLAVTDAPRRVRGRYREERARAAAERDRRRAARRPPWARVDCERPPPRKGMDPHA